MMNKWLNKIQPIYWPTPCACCGRLTTHLQRLCPTCHQHLPWRRSPQCIQCATPLVIKKTNEEPRLRCGQCLQHPPPFTTVFAPLTYQWPINKLLIKLKFQQQLPVATLLGHLLCDQLMIHWEKQHPWPSCIIPMPLHKRRLKQRGFNQAIEIARPIAKRLGCTLDRFTCERIKNTAAQTELQANQRRQNVRHAFKLNTKLASKHVVIIDDIVTTSHTCRELSQTLRQNGVERVDIWCVAKTSFPS